MHDLDTRTAVFELKRKGHGIRLIARALGLSKNTVKSILKSGQREVPSLERAQKAEPHLDQIRELYAECKGNLVRVHEKLVDADVELPYSTLTAFCRHNGIGVKEKVPAGEYHFKPGQEMQHDTSPHRVKIGGALRLVQCASLVFCFSRRIFAQVYPTFNRFYCKVFLTAALRALGGSCRDCMVDNSSVVIAHGSGKNAVPAPEMEAFSNRFGFEFMAHEIGDANRSARVERPFHFIENNFYPGRVFTSIADTNEQMADWCARDQHRFR
jgi:transposase